MYEKTKLILKVDHSVLVLISSISVHCGHIHVKALFFLLFHS